ncbi:MAG: MFS transporter [Ostreibacterium sp.]
MNRDSRIIVIVAIGMFLSTFDTGVVSIAVTNITDYFGHKGSAGALILTAVTLCGLILVFGALSMKRGVVVVFNAGMTLFMLASLLCAASWSMWSLIASRSIQGIAAAMVQATAIALISQYVSDKTR